MSDNPYFRRDKVCCECERSIERDQAYSVVGRMRQGDVTYVYYHIGCDPQFAETEEVEA